MSLSNTATPIYYGQFRDAVLRGEIPVCLETSLEMNRIDDLIANPGVYYDDKAVEKIILKNFSIINGAQTTSALGRFLKEARMDASEEDIEKLKKVIAEVLSVDPDEITMETTFTDDLGADSLDLFQIIMGLEEEFDIEIPPEKAENITTVEEAVELIKSEIGQ